MPILPGRSAVPTLEEWNAVTKEVNVKGSSALQCETKMLREWLRVSCRGKNDTGGTPVSVITEKGGFGAYLFASGGVTSIVLPFVEGIDATFRFAWTDKSHPCTSSGRTARRCPTSSASSRARARRSTARGSTSNPASAARRSSPTWAWAPACATSSATTSSAERSTAGAARASTVRYRRAGLPGQLPGGHDQDLAQLVFRPVRPGQGAVPGQPRCDVGSTGELVCIEN
jgi:hypothetical protein